MAGWLLSLPLLGFRSLCALVRRLFTICFFPFTIYLEHLSQYDSLLTIIYSILDLSVVLGAKDTVLSKTCEVPAHREVTLSSGQ